MQFWDVDGVAFILRAQKGTLRVRIFLFFIDEKPRITPKRFFNFRGKCGRSHAPIFANTTETEKVNKP